MAAGMPERSSADRGGSRRAAAVKSGMASTIFSLGTGDFLEGLLSRTGAFPSVRAVLSALSRGDAAPIAHALAEEFVPSASGGFRD